MSEPVPDDGGSDEEAPVKIDASVVARTDSKKRFSMFVRDTGITSCDPGRASEIKEAERFLTSMPDVSYEVVKAFPWGARKNRVLKLTSAGVENMRGAITTSFHTYKSIVRITLRDLDSFVIQYEESHDYTYRSPVAMQIVQEITTRTAITRTTEKKKLTYEIALKYQQELAEEQEASGAAGSRESVLASRGSIEAASGSNNTLTEGGQSPSRSIHKYRSFVDASLSKAETTDVRRQVKASKLMSIFGNTEQQRLEEAVEKILLNASTFEGKAVSAFLKNFSVLEKNPTTVGANVRMFMTGLKEHMLEYRKEELTKLLVTATTDSFQPDELSLHNVIERSLQRVIITPLRTRLLACMGTLTLDADVMIHRKIASSKLKSQAEIGVLPQDISPTNWGSAVVELNKGFGSSTTPTEYLASLLATARAIYNSVNYDRVRQGLPPAFLSADSFLPIFIYVVVQLKEDLTEHLETLTEYLWHLSNPEQLNGEGGYYLTVFVSALQYIKMHLLEQVPIDNGAEMVDMRDVSNVSQPLSSSSASSPSIPSRSGSGSAPSSSPSSASASPAVNIRGQGSTPSSPIPAIRPALTDSGGSLSSSPGPSPTTAKRESVRIIHNLKKAALP